MLPAVYIIVFNILSKFQCNDYFYNNILNYYIRALFAFENALFDHQNT